MESKNDIQLVAVGDFIEIQYKYRPIVTFNKEKMELVIDHGHFASPTQTSDTGRLKISFGKTLYQEWLSSQKDNNPCKCDDMACACNKSQTP